VAVTKGCTDGFCIDDTVITKNLSSGKVVGYFNNGDVVVYIQYYGNSRHTSDSIGVTHGCTRDFCVGDTVIAPDNASGTIVGLMANGEVVVYIQYYGNRSYRTDQLAVTKAICTNIYRHRAYYCTN
jgi:hypothetical protein